MDRRINRRDWLATAAGATVATLAFGAKVAAAAERTKWGMPGLYPGRVIEVNHPGSIVLAHPECPANILEISDVIGGTEKMRKYVASIPEKKTFLVATEANMIHPLMKAAPQHEYIPVPGIMTSTGETCACGGKSCRTNFPCRFSHQHDCNMKACNFRASFKSLSGKILSMVVTL